jgi:hypothetical protein
MYSSDEIIKILIENNANVNIEKKVFFFFFFFFLKVFNINCHENFIKLF